MTQWWSPAERTCFELQYHNNIIMQNSQIVGNITEQKCFLKCIEMGYIVSKPLFDNARYDFILDTGRTLLKIQVKSSRWTDESHSGFSFNCYSQHSLGGGNKRMKYTKKEIDFFMTEQEGIFYLYPVSETGILEKTLRVLPTINNQTINISFAKDYIFERIIKDY